MQGVDYESKVLIPDEREIYPSLLTDNPNDVHPDWVDIVQETA